MANYANVIFIGGQRRGIGTIAHSEGVTRRLGFDDGAGFLRTVTLPAGGAF